MTFIDPATIYQASVYRSLGLYDESFKVASDFDFSLRVISSGLRIQKSKCPIVGVRMGGYAEQNKQLASYEALLIGTRYTHLPLPELAFACRRLGVSRPDFIDHL